MPPPDTSPTTALASQNAGGKNVPTLLTEAERTLPLKAITLYSPPGESPAGYKHGNYDRRQMARRTDEMAHLSTLRVRRSPRRKWRVRNTRSLSRLPTRTTPIQRMTDDNRTWLKPQQVSEIRDTCYSGVFQNRLQTRNDAIIALLYDAGLRPTELVDVTTEMFDPDDGVIRLPSSAQKQYPTDSSPPPAEIELGRTEYTADTVRTLNQYISARENDSMFLFGDIRTRTVRYMVKKCAENSGIEPYAGFAGRGDPSDISPYTFRHSVAYRLLSACDGYTMYDVRNRLRHRSISTTEQHYDFFDSV